MTSSERIDKFLAELFKSVVFWVVAAICFLSLSAVCYAEDEHILAAVVESNPYYGKSQNYSKRCIEGTTRCWLIGDPPEYYATTFTNGRLQFTILTAAQFPHDLWFDIVRNCDSGKCAYKSAVLSQYQSPETLAIDEIQKQEQLRYLLNPKRMY